MCAVGRYVSPEVLAGQSKSAKSDIYSFGRIGRKIVHLWKWIRGGNLERIPTVMKTVLDQCVLLARDERPEMRSVVRLLEDWEDEVVVGKARWSPWAVDEKEYSADKPRVVLDDGELSEIEADMSRLEHAFSSEH